MTLKFITTGGTIDKVYFDAKSEFEVGPPQILEILKDANTHIKVEVESVLLTEEMLIVLIFCCLPFPLSMHLYSLPLFILLRRV